MPIGQFLWFPTPQGNSSLTFLAQLVDLLLEQFAFPCVFINHSKSLDLLRLLLFWTAFIPLWLQLLRFIFFSFDATHVLCFELGLGWALSFFAAANWVIGWQFGGVVFCAFIGSVLRWLQFGSCRCFGPFLPGFSCSCGVGLLLWPLLVFSFLWAMASLYCDGHSLASLY